MDPITEMYPDLHRQLDGLVRRKARKLVKWMPLDDAIQEGRIALWRALHSYDAAKSNGDLERYVGTCLDNAYRALYARSTAQRRMPRTSSQNEDGSFDQRPVRPASFDALSDGDVPTVFSQDPEALVADIENTEAIRVSLSHVWGTLNEREQEVLECMVWPTDDVITDGERTPNVEIARVLGLTKNQVDYAIQKIRMAVLSEVTRGGFSPVVRDAVASTGRTQPV